jgi:predicted permease
MPLFTRLSSAWNTVVRGRRLDRDLDEELQGFLETLVERKVASGMDPHSARRAALLEVGGVEQVKERVRENRIGGSVEGTLRDVHHAWRGVRRSPGFALSAIATLALGVGANTAIFSVVNALLIEPLPYRDAARLVFVWADQTSEGYPRAPLSGPELSDLDRRSSRFEGFGAIWATTAALTGEGDPQQLRIGMVTTDFFSLLGADAGLGRTFADGDDSLAAPTSILLGHAVWQRRYGSDPSIVGSRIQVNGNPATVVGVMPAEFRLLLPPDSAVPDDLEAWVPLNRRFPDGPRGQRFLRVIGRMRDGVTVQDAQSDIARVGREISREFAAYGTAGRQFETVALHADSTRDVRGPLLALFAGVGILLVIACVNVASLLVARAASRTRETAVRMALGAGYGRLLRQHLVEGLLLTALGGALGLVLGNWALAAMVAMAPDSLSRIALATVDPRVVVVSCATVLAWGSALSLAPLGDARRISVVNTLRHDGRSPGGAVRRPLRSALIVSQVALSVILLIGAGLLVRTFVNIQRVDAGFQDDGVLSFRVALPGSRYPNGPAFNAFSRRLQAELLSLPGATAAAGISHAPYDHVPNWGGGYLSRPGQEQSTAPQADYRAITPGLIELLGVRLIEGRGFTELDDVAGPPVVIVDDKLAARTWPGQSAVGQRIGVDPFVTGTSSVWATVVGVVKHVRHRSPIEEVREQIYFTQRQVQRNPSVFVVRTPADAAALAGPLRALVARLDGQLPIYDVRMLGAYATGVRATRQFTMVLALLFAAAALALASVGVYGLIAYSVTERHHEFGVRLALGASARQVAALVLREAAGLAAKGLMAGALAAAVVTWLLSSQLFGVGPWDPVTYAAVVPVLGLVAAVACVVPLRRATSTSPLEALRAE